MDEQKSIADIIAAMRDYSNACNDGYHTDYKVVRADMCKYADQSEAALMRELTACEQTTGSLQKLRMALVRLAITSEIFLRTHSAQSYADTMEALEKAKAALAATSNQNTGGLTMADIQGNGSGAVP